MAEINSLNFCHATVMHKRLRPAINSFIYKVFYICFDIDKISSLSSKFLSINCFNLFSFYEKDHTKNIIKSEIKKDLGQLLRTWINEILIQKNLNHKIDKVFLMSFPRILGYAFNPVSFWFCIDKEENLIAVLAEVNNTFGENHNYLIFNQDHSPILENQYFTANKEFHVSPFFEVSGNYKFRFIFNKKNCAAFIDYSSNNLEKSLLTSVITKNEKLSDLVLIKAFFAIPLMTFKVIFLIHWQALKIIFKKIKYIKKPQKLNHNLTFNNE
jgi:DUF1365 family protein